MKKALLILSFFCFISNDGKAGDLEIKSVGNLNITNFSPSDYKGENQNWDITIGRNGLIYVANYAMVEGGTNYWKHFYLPNGGYIRSIYSMDGNCILVGGAGELGIFKPDIIPGEMIYSSLMNKLDSSYHSFGTIWQILPYHNSMLLRAGKALFKYENDTITPLIFGHIVDYFNVLRDTIFLRIIDQGLGYMNKGSFELLPFGREFANIKIVGIEALNNKEYLIFTDDKGVFITDKVHLRTFGPLDHKYLKDSQISRVCFLMEKYFAVGTVKNGLYIFDRDGKLIQHLNRRNGLQNNTIISMKADSTNNLWLGLDKGISYVELNSCISHLFSDRDIGTGYVSYYFKGKLYLGTNQGLFVTEWDTSNVDNNVNNVITAIDNVSGQVWYLNSSENVLYCGHHKGLFRIDGNQGVLLNPVEGCWQIDPLTSFPGYYLESTYRGFYLLKLNYHGDTELIKKLDALPTDSRRFKEDNNGFLWVKTPDYKIFRFKIDPYSLEVADFEEMTGYKGLPDYTYTNLVGNKHQVFVSTGMGMYGFNYEDDRFENMELYDQVVGIGELCSEFFLDNYNRIWYVKDREIGYFSLNFGKVDQVYLPFNRILNSYTNTFGSIYAIDQEDVLLSVDDGFYHYKCNCNETLKNNYHALIVNLTSSFDPSFPGRPDNALGPVPVYRHKKNAFEFSFTSDFFESPENIVYQFKLEGFDDEWSEWSSRNSKEYTNLFEGTYTLKVRARNGFGNESSETSFSFKVSPPYYRSITAYLIYFIFILIILYITRYLRLKRVELIKRKLIEKKQQEIEERKKKFEEEQMKARQKIIELEKEQLRQDLLHKSRELSNSMINILHKNEIFRGHKEEMQKLYQEKDIAKRDHIIRKLIRNIDSEISSKRDLELFDSNFSAVHEDFINRLKERFSDMNQNDQRLCTFLKMNKTTKEIASLMNMSVRGVETSRYRLRKKMNLDRDANLFDTISHI